MPEDYILSWVKSSVRIHNVGLYDTILDRYPLTNKNVLELGVGSGLETEKIWLKEPETFLGIDKKSRMLSLSERYLKSQGYPVNAKYINLPSFADRITGKNVLNDPDFDIKKDAINLALQIITSSQHLTHRFQNLLILHSLLLSEGMMAPLHKMYMLYWMHWEQPIFY